MGPDYFRIKAIKDKFPMHEDHIQSLYLNNAEFRSIVDDYYSCIKYLEKTKRLHSENLESIEEYEKMVRELELELRHHISSD